MKFLFGGLSAPLTAGTHQARYSAGKDTATEKATYPALYGVPESLKKADALVEAARRSLEGFGERGATLKELAQFLVERKK